MYFVLCKAFRTAYCLIKLLNSFVNTVFWLVSIQDYHHKLVCVTQKERFEIPVRAVGPRAILDFQDELILPVCPVKASTEKTQLVRNIGKSKAKFQLHTQRWEPIQEILIHYGNFAVFCLRQYFIHKYVSVIEVSVLHQNINSVIQTYIKAGNVSWTAPLFYKHYIKDDNNQYCT